MNLILPNGDKLEYTYPKTYFIRDRLGMTIIVIGGIRILYPNGELWYYDYI